jgi:amino acid permease
VLTWQGAVANLLPPLVNGGPTGAIIAFPLVAFGVMTQVLVMAEMASMYVVNCDTTTDSID